MEAAVLPQHQAHRIRARDARAENEEHHDPIPRGEVREAKALLQDKNLQKAEELRIFPEDAFPAIRRPTKGRDHEEADAVSAQALHDASSGQAGVPAEPDVLDIR